jgi:ribosomal protein S12 methylthiotransferase accessory factor
MAACRRDGLTAAIRVLEEAASIRLALGWSNEAADREAILSSILSGQVNSPEMFGLLYADAEAPNRFQFALQHPPIKSGFSIPIDTDSPLNTIVARLTALDMEVIVVDVTLPEVRACGFVVVRVIVPELMPISFSHHIRYLAHPRLYTAPPRLGWGNRTPAMITRDPLPYA